MAGLFLTVLVDWGCSTSGSGSVSFSETLGREEPNVKKPPLWACACCRGAGAGRNWALGAGTGALGAGTGALEATTGALGAATGALEAGALAAGAGWAGAGAGAGAGILCLALAADPKVCASSKKVLPPFVVLVGMFGMEMGTKGLVVAGLKVGMESLGAAAADWIGVNGDENLKPENVPGVKESGKMENVEEGEGGGGARAVDLTVVVKAVSLLPINLEVASLVSRMGAAAAVGAVSTATS